MDARVKRRRGYTRLSRKNQVTIPGSVVESLGLEPGDELRVESRNGRIVLHPAGDLAGRRARAVARWSGTLNGVYEHGYLKRLRDEWR
jgi:AbrB family looped-hinge helix DNA binding protein